MINLIDDCKKLIDFKTLDVKFLQSELAGVVVFNKTKRKDRFTYNVTAISITHQINQFFSQRDINLYCPFAKEGVDGVCLYFKSKGLARHRKYLKINICINNSEDDKINMSFTTTNNDEFLRFFMVG